MKKMRNSMEVISKWIPLRSVRSSTLGKNKLESEFWPMDKRSTEVNKRLLRTVFLKENNKISSQEKSLKFLEDFKVPIRICKPRIFKNKILRKKSTKEKNQKENNNKYNFNI